MKILAILILYNPKDNIISKIKEYLNLFDFLYIWDNSAYIIPEIKQFCDNATNISYKCYKVNIGLSAAYNKGIEYAKKNNFDIIATLDQDSSFVDLDKLIMFSKTYLKKHKCILGVDTMMNRIFSGIDLLSRDWVINSGLFISIDTIDKIGGYNELFFVDGIDIEMCLRARKANIFSYIFTGSKINQIYGELQSFRLFHKQYTLRIYSPNRVKEILFSHILLYRKYRDNKILQELSCIIKLNVKLLFFQKEDRLFRLYSIAWGIVKGLTTSLNKLDLSTNKIQNEACLMTGG